MWKATTHMRSGLRNVGLTPGRHKLCSKRAASSNPPLPPPKKGGVLKYVVLTTGLLGGGTVGYAWYDPSFRDLMTKTLGLESLPPLPSLPALPSLPSLPSISLPSFGQKKSTPPEAWPLPVQEKTPTEPEPIQLPDKEEEKTLPKSEPAKEVPKSVSPEEKARKEKEQQAAEEKLQQQKLEQKLKLEAEEKQKAEQEAEMKLKKDEESRQAEIVKEKKELELKKLEEEKKENSALEKKLEDLLDDAHGKVEEALVSQRLLMDTIKSHADNLQKVMEQIDHKDGVWQSFMGMASDRQKTTWQTETMVNTAREQLVKLQHVIMEAKDNAVTKANESLTSAEEKVHKLSEQIQEMSSEIVKMESTSAMSEKMEEMFEQGKTDLMRDLENFLPNLNLESWIGEKLREEDVKILIAYAHIRLRRMIQQLSEHVIGEERRVRRALEEDGGQDTTSINEALEKVERLHAMEKEKWELEARAAFEKELRHMLAMQAAAHTDHIRDVLSSQETRLNDKFEEQLSLQILDERLGLKTEIAGWQARMKGIETAVEAQAEKGKAGQQAKQLWLACLALNGVIRVGDKCMDTWEDQVTPLDSKVMAIADASGHHPFVATVIETIPEEAMTRGVWTEKNLRSRFKDVGRKCRRVAIVDENGGSIFNYFLSYLQSYVIFSNVYLKSDTDVINPKEMDTFCIVDHAQYWLDQGNMEMAVRFMNQLQGQPRVLASDWIKEAKLLVETKQAAESITTFASATGLGSLF